MSAVHLFLFSSCMNSSPVSSISLMTIINRVFSLSRTNVCLNQQVCLSDVSYEFIQADSSTSPVPRCKIYQMYFTVIWTLVIDCALHLKKQSSDPPLKTTTNKETNKTKRKERKSEKLPKLNQQQLTIAP